MPQQLPKLPSQLSSPSQVGRNRVRQSATVVAAAILMLTLGGLFAWSVLVTPLQESTKASLTALSSVFSCAIISFSLAMVLGPSLYRRCDASVTASIVCVAAAVGLAITGLSNSIWWIGAGYGVLFGVANGFGYSLALQAVSCTVNNNRGLAIGFIIACYALGAMLWAFAFSFAITAFGVRSAFVVVAFIFLTIAFLVAKLFSIAAFNLGQSVTPSNNFKSVMRQRTFWLLWSEFFCVSVVGLMIIGHIAGLVTATGGSAPEIAFGVGLVAATNGFGRLTTGWLCDRFSFRLVLAIMPLLGAAGLVILIVWSVPNTTLLALSLMGNAYGSNASAIPIATAQYYGAAQTSYIFGRLITAWGLAGLVGPLLASWLFDVAGNYEFTLVCGAVTAAIGGVIGVVLPRRTS